MRISLWAGARLGTFPRRGRRCTTQMGRASRASRTLARCARRESSAWRGRRNANSTTTRVRRTPLRGGTMRARGECAKLKLELKLELKLIQIPFPRSCGNGGTTPGFGSMSVSQCTCDANFYLGESSCQSCPANSGADAGATSIFQCWCETGFFLLEGECVSCDGGTTASAGSVSLDQCICNPGYFLGVESCEACLWLRTTPGPGATAIAECVCDRGLFERLEDGVCTVCPVHSSQTGEIGPNLSTQCVCDANYYLHEGSESCVSCGYGMTQFEGSTSSTECICDKGYFLQESEGSCVSCGVGETTVTTGATSPSQCVCASNYFLSATTSSCDPCPENSYPVSECNANANATQRNATQRNATQRNTTQRNATQHNTTQRNATNYSICRLALLDPPFRTSASVQCTTTSVQRTKHAKLAVPE